jgi:Cytochrome oxidase complex assembly protein 1
MMSEPQVRAEPKPIPPEIDRWNWGAFLLSWIWGVGNNTFIALLALIPIVGQVAMPFVLGFKGSRWAWRNGRWDSVEHFKRVQRLWAIWGAIIWLGFITLFGGLIGGGFYFFKHSEAYTLGVSTLQASPVATNLLGTPITAGFPSGSINYQNGSAKAVLRFSASGPKAAGTVFLEAVRNDGAWTITRLALKLDGRDGVIDLVNGATSNST